MKPRLSISLRAVGVRRLDKWVLRDLTWDLKPGERWALLGENGAGKTQLLKLIGGEVWPTPIPGAALGMRTDAGRMYRLGRRGVDLIEAKRRMAYIGGERQDKYARYGWNLRVRDLVATGLHRTDLLLAQVTALEAKRVAAELRHCGLSRLAEREFLSLSYGEKRLGLLARALVQDPDWLLLDELYNGLDVHFRGRIDEVLEAARRRGQSWIASAHRAMDVPAGTRVALELQDGRIRAIKRLAPADLRLLQRRA
jgi:ABC-type molybdenum transport system ATPase subunit/photorepair protein PhrA